VKDLNLVVKFTYIGKHDRKLKIYESYLMCKSFLFIVKILLHMNDKCSSVLLHVFAYRMFSLRSVKTLPNTDDV